MDIPQNLIEALFIAILTIITTKIVGKVIEAVLNKIKHFNDNLTGIYLIRDIVIYIIYFIALMDILNLFGVNLYGTLLSLGIVGIAVSLAAKDIISNLFSGIILIIGKSIKTGDTIEINKTKGVVQYIHLRTTTIKDDDGIISTIPKSTLTNNLYKLYKKPKKYRININTVSALNISLNKLNLYNLWKIN